MFINEGWLQPYTLRVLRDNLYEAYEDATQMTGEPSEEARQMAIAIVDITITLQNLDGDTQPHAPMPPADAA